jgi:hypothetical protein
MLVYIVQDNLYRLLSKTLVAIQSLMGRWQVNLDALLSSITMHRKDFLTDFLLTPLRIVVHLRFHPRHTVPHSHSL